MKKRNILAASDRQPAFSLKDSDGERVGKRSPDVGFLFSRAVIHDKMRPELFSKAGLPEGDIALLIFMRYYYVKSDTGTLYDHAALGCAGHPGSRFFLIPYLHPDPGYPSDSSSERADISRAFYRAGGMAAAACSQLDPG